jgi:citryl-CoA synthetase large subunit
VEELGHRGTFGRYVDLDGDIVLVLSGGGASLVALDAIHAAGGRAANYLEMSGNPEAESVKKVMSVVLGKPGIRAMWIAGSFANFTDIDATVMAVLDAVRDSGLHVPIAIRRDGPNADAAVVHATEWSEMYGIPVRFDRADVSLEESAQNLMDMLKTV